MAHKPTDPTTAVFDETVQFADQRAPFPGWQPSPTQIVAWSQQILDGLTPVERQRRLRVDLRPQVRCADGTPSDMSAEAYDAHQRADDG